MPLTIKYWGRWNMRNIENTEEEVKNSKILEKLLNKKILRGIFSKKTKDNLTKLNTI